MNIGSAATSSATSAYGTYYDPFYANTGHAATWSAYAAASGGAPNASSASGPCSLLSQGHKVLSGAHFTPVHQQRRKRRVLFTQAQVSTSWPLYSSTRSVDDKKYTS